MPLVAGLMAALEGLGAALIAKWLVGLGISAVTYIGVSTVWESAQANIQGAFQGVGADVVVLIGMSGIDQAIMIVLSAISSALAIKGITAAGGFKRFVKT